MTDDPDKPQNFPFPRPGPRTSFLIMVAGILVLFVPPLVGIFKHNLAVIGVFASLGGAVLTIEHIIWPRDRR